MIPWYERSFGREYLDLYAHRDLAEARRDIEAITALINPHRDEPLLDLGCGAGRHLVALKEAGFTSLVGLDLSAELLEEAKSSLGDTVELVRTDMRQILFSSHFETVLSLFTTFGYFETDEENELVLTAVAGCLKVGGVFLMDYLNSTRVLKDLVPEDERMLGHKRVRHRRSVSPDGSRVEKETIITGSGDQKTQYHESVRLYSVYEVTQMLENTGFEVIRFYGSLQGEDFEADSKRLIATARKR